MNEISLKAGIVSVHPYIPGNWHVEDAQLIIDIIVDLRMCIFLQLFF